MPSLNAGDLAGCLHRKLRAVESSGKHRTFEIFDDDGVLVARTLMSHGWRGNTPLSDRMVSSIKGQLGLARSRDLVDLVGCPLSRDEYLALAKQP